MVGTRVRFEVGGGTGTNSVLYDGMFNQLEGLVR